MMPLGFLSFSNLNIYKLRSYIYYFFLFKQTHKLKIATGLLNVRKKFSAYKRLVNVLYHYSSTTSQVYNLGQ